MKIRLALLFPRLVLDTSRIKVSVTKLFDQQCSGNLRVIVPEGKENSIFEPLAKIAIVAKVNLSILHFIPVKFISLQRRLLLILLLPTFLIFYHLFIYVLTNSPG